MPLDPELPDYRGVRTAAPKLFDLSRDPGEQQNLAGKYSDLVRNLSEKYDTWFAEVMAEWKAATEEIRKHDQVYWQQRDPPDARRLFDGFWQWRGVDADPQRDDPLKVFKGYWTKPSS